VLAWAGKSGMPVEGELAADDDPADVASTRSPMLAAVVVHTLDRLSEAASGTRCFRRTLMEAPAPFGRRPPWEPAVFGGAEVRSLADLT
jgi:hypothetical protein